MISSSFAGNNLWGITASYGNGKAVHLGAPKDTFGYRVAGFIQPKGLMWSHVNVYLDASYAQWYTNYYQRNRRIGIYTLAPAVRIFLFKTNSISPYLDGSIGFSYMNKDFLGNRSWDIRFAYQDRGGIGLAFGPKQRYFTDLQIIHYSNGSLTYQNSGITIPLMLSFGLRF